jgi:putative transposase
VRFIDEREAVFTVESICRVLTERGWAIASSTYRATVSRQPSARARRDDELKADFSRVHDDYNGVFGARKVWLVINRQGIRAGDVVGPPPC